MADTQNPSSESDVNWICVGAVSGAHGVKGQAKITSFTGEMAAIKSYSPIYLGPNFSPVGIVWGGSFKSGFLARIDGLDTREDVLAAKGRKLYVSRDQLPEPDEDEFYFSDLEGLAAFATDGTRLGNIRAVGDYGAGPVLELLLDEKRKSIGRTPLVPFLERWVPNVDVAAGRITVDLDGWLGEQTVVRPDDDIAADKP